MKRLLVENLATIELARVVGTLGAHGDELFRLDDVGGEVVAVDATGVEADGFLSASRFG